MPFLLIAFGININRQPLKGGITLACSQSVVVQVCWVRLFDITTGMLEFQTIECGVCPVPPIEIHGNELTVRTPFTYHYTATINDNLTQNFSFSNSTSP